MTDSPSLLLQRAADELERAAADVPAPKFWDREIRGADLSESGAAWAKLVGPPVAAPLVAWLRYAQCQYEVAERRVQRYDYGSVDNHVSESDQAALDFARQVLGLPSRDEEELA